MTILEVFGLILSIVGLTTSIVFATFIFNLHTQQTELKTQQAALQENLNYFEQILERHQKIIIASLSVSYPLYGDDFKRIPIKGSEILEWIQKKYLFTNIYEALYWYLNQDEETMCEQYIKEVVIPQLEKEKQADETN